MNKKRKYEAPVNSEIGYWMCVNGRVLRILRENGINSVSGIIHRKREFFEKLPGFGKNCMKQLDEFMELYEMRYNTKMSDYIYRKVYYFNDRERLVYDTVEMLGMERCLQCSFLTKHDLIRYCELESYQKVGPYAYKKIKK
jgi:hypothetical protein